MTKIQHNSLSFGAYIQLKAKQADADKLANLVKQSTNKYVIITDNKKIKIIQVLANKKIFLH